MSSGDLATVAGTLTSATTGKAAALEPVKVTGVSLGKVVFEREYLTQKNGRFSAQLPVLRTTTVTVSHPGTSTLAAQKTHAGKFIAVPKVAITYDNTRARVLVSPAAKQRILVQRKVQGRWVAAGQAVAKRSTPLSLATATPGRWRVKIGAKAGYGSLTSKPWKVTR